MADIAPTYIDGEGRTTIVQWDLGADDTGLPVRYAGAADRTVQVIGTFGGATVAIQGTLENATTGQTWLPVTDAQGNAISMTSAGLEAITELVRQIRPVVTGGTGTAVKVLMLLRVTL
jgi:hypothetical protein